MVISNFYIISVIVYPFKDNSPLVINSYAPKSFKVSRHFFKPIARWNTKKSQGRRSIELAQVASPECGLKNLSPLRLADIERIHEARDILISNMQNPPSLFNLARQVGLNDTKLKRGFRQAELCQRTPKGAKITAPVLQWRH